MSKATAESLAKLPEHCMSRDPVSGRIVTLFRGRVGFVPAQSQEDPESYNRRIGLTYEQVDAMEYGSRLGFGVVLADVDYVRKIRSELGQPIGPITEICSVPARPAQAPASAATVQPVPRPAPRETRDEELALLPEFRLTAARR